MTCQWCGDEHGVEQLCQRAQRGMTRRSFLFLTSAALVAQALPTLPSSELVQMVYHHGRHNIGQIVAEAWNKIITERVADNIFNMEASIFLPMKAELTKRLKETP